MSILLDALKKSEAQRRLGETPTIHGGGSEGLNSEARESRWIPVALLSVSAIVIAWFGWLQFREPVMEADPVGSEQLVDAAPGAEVPATVSGEASGSRSDGDVDSEPVPDADAAANPDLDAVARQSRAQPRTPVEDYRPEPGAEPDAVAADALAGGPAVDGPRQASHPDPAAESVEPSLAELAEASDIPRVRSPSSGDSESRPMERHIPEPISYWELPQGIRDILPELRITVLVYAERPEDRFVLVNGERLVEEQELDEDVKLEEIRREGVVFLFRNYRFLVKG